MTSTIAQKVDSSSVLGDTVHVLGDSEHVLSESIQMGDLTRNQWDALVTIAEPSRCNRNLPSNLTEELILKLCQNHWLTKKQLGVLMNRNRDSLRMRFLTPMVKKKLLNLKYPDRPSRTDQAYKKA